MISHIHGCIHKDNLFLCCESNSERSGLMGDIYFTFMLYQIKRLSQRSQGMATLLSYSYNISWTHSFLAHGSEERETGELNIDLLHCLSQEVMISLPITFYWL